MEETTVPDDEGDGRFVRLLAELHVIAKNLLRGQGPVPELETAALVNETYLRMRTLPLQDFPADAQLIAYAARTMRSVLVDFARRRACREGGRTRVPLDDFVTKYERSVAPLLDLDDALRRLERQEPHLYEVALRKLFTGLPRETIASDLQCSVRTVEHYWTLGKQWLSRTLR